MAKAAKRLFINGTVQGVGFRPHVYRYAVQYGLTGWVLNGLAGVTVHVEGAAETLQHFCHDLLAHLPPAAYVDTCHEETVAPEGYAAFEIRSSSHEDTPTAHITPDMALCDTCLAELFDPQDQRYLYPYITCTNCGPRYSIITALPYDRPRTTMAAWPLCDACSAQYHNPHDRRFHAQPLACPRCGPAYQIIEDGSVADADPLGRAAQRLRDGAILAIKGIGGYHLTCDANNPTTLELLRTRKFRKEKPFALMVRDLATAELLVHLTHDTQALLCSPARPIVLAPAKNPLQLPHIAPDTHDLGIMLPYTPVHHLLFDSGAPAVLVMTSANRSSEPIAYEDDAALKQLRDIADAFLVGQRPIARQVDDSVVRNSPLGVQMLRRSRGYAPMNIARIGTKAPILALGADLKNSVALAVDGKVMLSQHIGDLTHAEAHAAFALTVSDLLGMYGLKPQDVTVAHDLHPSYHTSHYGATLDTACLPVQHHEAHIASVCLEHGLLDEPVMGVAFDGTGYGYDGAIWGGEILIGSVLGGFERAAHVAYGKLVGGDAAARFPVQAAAGFLGTLADEVDLTRAPFHFPKQYTLARQLAKKDIRCFTSSSVGRLFDTVAALLGFTREVSYEGQAAVWLEHLAQHGTPHPSVAPLTYHNGTLDPHHLLKSLITARQHHHPLPDLARGFITRLAQGTTHITHDLAQTHHISKVVLSGGVFQNQLLLADIKAFMQPTGLQLYINHRVPPNDGGISVGQLACALRAF